MKDYAFIKLEDSLQKAITQEESTFAQNFYYGCIQLSPSESYTQITNLKNGIAFNGNYDVFVCDCQGNELLDITSKVKVSQLLNNKGIAQIIFEITNIGTDFSRLPVVLKFKHNVTVFQWFSNIINITDYEIERTSRFEYKDYYDFYGIPYNRTDVYQSIRLRCAFVGNNVESTSKEYTSFDGIKVTSRLIQTEIEKYHFNEIDNFTYNRLNKLLTHSVVYINDKRVTNKQTIGGVDYLQGTNTVELDFSVPVNEDELLSVILIPPILSPDFDDLDFDNNDFYTN